MPVLSLHYTGNAGNFDFTRSLQGALSLTSLSWKISDYYPLWAEFSVAGIEAGEPQVMSRLESPGICAEGGANG